MGKVREFRLSARRWCGGLIAIGCLAAIPLAFARPASAAVINFDDLVPPGPGGTGLPVNTQYAGGAGGLGVSFNNPSAFDFSKGSFAMPSFPHSPNVAVEPCVGQEFCKSPVQASFTADQRTVKVWVGFASPLSAPLGVRLTGFNASGGVAGTADATLPASSSATPIRTPLAIDLATPAIRRIEVSVTTGGGFTGGLGVDDVEFSSAGPPPTCGASGPPTVALDQPVDGVVVQGDSFLLGGSVAANGADLTDATIHSESQTPRTGALFPTLIGPLGGSFGPTNFGGLLSLGVNEVSVSATNCAGTGTSSPHTVIRTVPHPAPEPAACIPQTDHPAIHVATSAADLDDVLRTSFQGQVIVPSGANYDMTPFHNPDPIPLRSGVQLVGERGALGRRPLIHSDDLGDYSLFLAQGPDVCVEGLHLEGPSHSHAAGLPDAFGIQVTEDPAAFHMGDPDPVVIADNELAGWTGGAAYALGTVGWPNREAPPGYDGPRMTRADAKKVRVERNYIHHNARDSGGYGVVVGGSSYATVNGNVFEFNRHDVTSEGQSFSGYYARFNYGLEGEFRYGDNGYYGTHFDVHGTRDPGHWVGGGAGEYHEIAYNTIRGDQEYECGHTGLFCHVRPALTLRGRPSVGLDFLGNILVHDNGDAVLLKPGDDGRLDPDHPGTFNYHDRGGNRHNTDYSTQLATGDFDGDGRTDVFLSNGTGWFMSRAGIRPWEFLRPSNKLVRNDLGFADITGDGKTDVLYRDGAGHVGYVKSGAAANLTPLTTSPVPMKDLRFGDFDGDGRTDIFYTRNHQWRVWYGRTHTWTDTETSSVPISGMLFGEFDGVPGTDVAAVAEGRWSYSSGSTHPWARLNNKLVSSFGDAVAADFDGNGKTDIAFGSGKVWRYSADGRGPLARLRGNGDGARPLKGLLVGSFDGQPRATVVAYGRHDRNSFVIWRGLGSQSDFVSYSEQHMR